MRVASFLFEIILYPLKKKTLYYNFSDECEYGHIKPLGARKSHKMTTKEKALFLDQTQTVYKYYRAETNLGVLYSEMRNTKGQTTGILIP